MKPYHLPRLLACAALLGAVSLSPAIADTLTLNPTADGYIRASQNTTQTANTTNVIFLVGDTATANDYLRGVLSFDLSNPALVGATINSVSLSLKINSVDSGGSANQNETLELHQLSSSFTEAGVSWTSRDGTNNWTAAGGDFGSTIATTTADPATVTVSQVITFSGSSLATSVGNSIGGSYFLLTKLATEDATRSIFRFASVNGSSASYPVLTIDFTPSAIPEPSTCALLGGAAALFLAFWRRRAA